MRDSRDPLAQNIKVQVRTSCKWDLGQVVDQAINSLKYQEIVGVSQPGKGSAPKMWSKASTRERKDLVISEVVKIE